MNPFKEYLEKKAAIPHTFMEGVKGSLNAPRAGKALGGALLGAGAAGAVGLAGAAASKLVDAATKARDFKSMLAFDAQLAAQHAEDPRLVNQMFSTLRAFNPAASRDPVVASSMVKQMVESPLHAPGQLVNLMALSGRDRGGLVSSMAQSALGGAKAGGGGRHSREAE